MVGVKKDLSPENIRSSKNKLLFFKHSPATLPSFKKSSKTIRKWLENCFGRLGYISVYNALPEHFVMLGSVKAFQKASQCLLQECASDGAMSWPYLLSPRVDVGLQMLRTRFS